jgi:CRISPR-associated protein Csx17
MELCRNGSKRNVQEVCAALGKAERALALAIGFRKANPFTKPVPLLSVSWISACDDKSPEFRLACALASAGIRENMEPVRVNKWVTWENENLPHVVWGEGRLADNLLTVLERRLLDSTRDNKFRGLTSYSNYPASLSDIAAFTRGEVDEKRLEDLLWGLNLIDWAQVESVKTSVQGTKSVPLAYALLKLCFLPVPLEDIKIPKQPAIIARARAGDTAGSTRLASKRLIASGFIPRVKVIAEDQQLMHRCAAALLFPIQYRDINTLADMVLQPTKKSQEKGE